jgi:hypothetical protein
MRARRVLGVTCAISALSLALFGCASEDKAETPVGATETASPSTEGPGTAATLLSQDEAERALLTTADLGNDYTATVADDTAPGGGIETTDLGCLSVLDDLDAMTDADTLAEIGFDDGIGASVGNSVASYSSAGEVSEDFARVKDAIDGCTSFQVEENAVQLSLNVSVDEEPINPTVDEQLNITVSGSATSQGVDLPVSLGFSFVRLENNLTTVLVFELSSSDRLPSYTEAAVARLDAVMKGESVPTPAGTGS